MATKAETRLKLHEQESEERRWEESLLNTPPTSGLLTLLKNNWGNQIFQNALKNVLGSISIPRDIYCHRSSNTVGGAAEDAAIREAWIRVVCTQATHWRRKEAERAKVGPRTSWEILGFQRDQFSSDEEFLTFLQSKQKSNRTRHETRAGEIEPHYDWLSNSHEVPVLAEALGISAMGLAKMCKRLSIPVTKARISRRSGTISYKGALRCLDEQLGKSINKAAEVAQRISRSMSTAHVNSAALGQVLAMHGAIRETAQPSQRAPTSLDPFSLP